ncbi:substrate-binding domain-containing protein [Spirosoma sp. BT702]|uniref:histidine kinase n=1 Tax=Spirosoma profusum TaxID=2771354 RepID=A0A927AVJ4_9BACT|nr:substrate-binding domain-containing protein [Spirosoma profusum]MBD2705210.1 substrate-binding domain-containing protein [Spirosoma profusum]
MRSSGNEHIQRCPHSFAGTKKRLCYLLFLVGWFAVAGCQSSGSERVYRIGFSQCTGGDEWRKTLLHDMKRELAFHPNYTLLYEDAANNTARQIRQVEALANQNIDLLIISPNESAPFTKVVEAIFRKGIPVILLDRKVNSELYNAYIGGDNVEIGRMAAEFVGKYLNGKGNVSEIWGLRSSSPAQERHKGFREELKKYPGIQVTSEIDGKWERDTARNVLNTSPDKFKNTNLIFAHNDVMAIGAYEVAKRNGLTDKLEFIGIDALPGPSAGMQAVADGTLKASFLYPTGGEEAIETAARILEGKAFKREQILTSIQVDAKNIRGLKAQSDKLLSQQADIEKQSQIIEQLTQTYSFQQNTLYVTLFSLLIAIALGVWAYYLLRARKVAYQTLEQQNEAIRQQKNQLEDVSQQARLATEDKLRFYAYISHEFNTPLSLILTPTEDLLSKKSVSPYELRASLSLVQKNAYRLLRLVDQMLDLRKSDAGKQQLRAAEQDVVAFTRDIVKDFGRKAEKQRIDLQFLTDLTVQPLWFDAEKLDKVLFNLLSNAFKYTPKGGLIHVRLDQLDGQIRIQVKDNGQGMTPDEQAHAFDLFFSGTRPFNLSKGLGLALSKEFMELHRGSISVQSTPERGTLFTVLLPLSNKHLNPSEQIIPDVNERSNTYQRSVELNNQPEIVSTLRSPEKSAATLLIVEDNDDLRTFLSDRLGSEFDIVAECNGALGWERALETIPDLVISDVMLPVETGLEMDGLQLTQRLKTDLRTSHIPVILLTAKGQSEHQIEGARAGADAYLTKPFNTTFLLETIRTTLANRRKWQQRLTSDFSTQTGNRQDKKFLNELTSLIEQNLSDSNFSVQKLSREMGLSRVQLYRKVQALLSMNIMDYLTEIRLKRAKYLLRETNRTMADIAAETGFNSAAYFTTFFKQHSGRTPSEYRKSPVGT